MKENEKMVLILAYFYPPLAGSGVYRSIKFSKYLSNYGWNQIVISTDRPPLTWCYMDESLVDEIPNGIELFRISDPYVDIHRLKLPDILRQADLTRLDDALNYVFEDDEEAQNLYQYVRGGCYKEIVKIIKFQVFWALDVLNFIEKERLQEKIDVIYTTSGPDSSHIVGYYLKKKYGIPWVADFRDEWINNPYFNFNMENNLDKLYFYLEKNIVQKADHVIPSLHQRSWGRTFTFENFYSSKLSVRLYQGTVTAVSNT